MSDKISRFPWRMRKMHDDGQPGEIYGVFHPQSVDFSDTVCNTFNEADARLISTAPDLLTIAEMGATMRTAQKAYFAARTQANLIASKQAESAFDKAVAASLLKVQGDTL